MLVFKAHPRLRGGVGLACSKEVLQRNLHEKYIKIFVNYVTSLVVPFVPL